MKKRKKKKSAARQEYMKERKRIQNYISRKKYEGYINIDFELPEIPQRVTQKAIRTLKEIKGRNILPHLQKVTHTGKGTTIPVNFMNQPVDDSKSEEQEKSIDEIKEEIKRKEKEKEEQEIMTKEQEAKLVVEGFLFRVQLELPPGADTLVIEFINQVVNQEGYAVVAETLNNMPDDIRAFLKRYGSDFDFEAFSTEFLDYLEKELGKNDRELGESGGWYRSQIEDIIESSLVTGVWDVGAAQ